MVFSGVQLTEDPMIIPNTRQQNGKYSTGKDTLAHSNEHKIEELWLFKWKYIIPLQYHAQITLCVDANRLLHALTEKLGQFEKN